MNSILTTIWLCLLVMGGYFLYWISFEVDSLENKLTTLNRGIAIEKEAIHVLQAEWSFLTSPQRIGTLSSTFLMNYTPIAPVKIIKITDIPYRLDQTEGEKIEGKAIPNQKPTEIRPTKRPPINRPKHNAAFTSPHQIIATKPIPKVSGKVSKVIVAITDKRG